MSKISNFKKKLVLLVVLLFAAFISLTFIGCNQANDNGNEFNTLKEGTLKVAVEANNYPVAYKNNDGKIVGVEINYLEKLCKEAGFQIEYVTMDFNRVVDAVEMHEVDISMNQISVTEARRQKVDFSEPYHRNGTSLYVKDNAGYTFDSLEEKAINSELKVATQDGTYFENFKSRFKGNVVNVSFSTVNEAVAAVQNGKADCFVYDSDPIAHLDLIKNQHLTDVFLDIMPVYNLGIALNKNLKGVEEKLNPIIKKMNDDNYLNNVRDYFYSLDKPYAWDGIFPESK